MLLLKKLNSNTFLQKASSLRDIALACSVYLTSVGGCKVRQKFRGCKGPVSPSWVNDAAKTMMEARKNVWTQQTKTNGQCVDASAEKCLDTADKD